MALLKAYRHWLNMEEPKWANIDYQPINYQDIIYYSAPKQKINLNSLDEVDPELRRTFEKLGISLDEQKRLSGVAVDAVIDSVSIATTFKGQLAEMGIIFCSMSEAIQEHPELIKEYIGSVVPITDNYFSALNAAVFSDGSFCFIPKRRSLPNGTFYLFPYQCRKYRPVRKNINCRGSGKLCELFGRMYSSNA